ncbi:hypothetical protein RHGRI_028377 [Rhododendron griersonianum]|uniref:non-specific serine/threonine protein kinase n=1 Tax=Rhododendron griersonianum TaxID=479676 RepID=A0AAV6IFN8_9ERIC|nr:hypothetical protein RHGRI_028377 [Rhododendron griersonianum]
MADEGILSVAGRESVEVRNVLTASIQRKIEPEARATSNGHFCSILNYDGRIAYEDIIKATNDFDIKHCVGTGGYGRVYKAQLPSGKVVALKKLHLGSRGVGFRQVF